MTEGLNSVGFNSPEWVMVTGEQRNSLVRFHIARKRLSSGKSGDRW